MVTIATATKMNLMFQVWCCCSSIQFFAFSFVHVFAFPFPPRARSWVYSIHTLKYSITASYAKTTTTTTGYCVNVSSMRAIQYALAFTIAAGRYCWNALFMQMNIVVKMNVEKKWLIYEVISTMPEMLVVKRGWWYVVVCCCCKRGAARERESERWWRWSCVCVFAFFTAEIETMWQWDPLTRSVQWTLSMVLLCRERVSGAEIIAFYCNCRPIKKSKLSHRLKISSFS